MKRDMDLVRDLLLKVEAGQGLTLDNLAIILLAEPKNLEYHVNMLVNEASILSGIDASSDDGLAWLNLELTWHGHEFLDSIRDPEVWRRVKEGAGKIGSFSFETLSMLAKGLIKTKVEQHTGLTF